MDSVKFNKIKGVVLFVNDIEKSKDWYAQLLNSVPFYKPII